MANYETQQCADSKAVPQSQVMRKRLIEHTGEMMLLADRVEKAAARLLGPTEVSAARNPILPSGEPPSPIVNDHAGQLNLELNNFERLRQRLSAAIGRIEEFV